MPLADPLGLWTADEKEPHPPAGHPPERFTELAGDLFEVMASGVPAPR